VRGSCSNISEGIERNLKKDHSNFLFSKRGYDEKNILCLRRKLGNRDKFFYKGGILKIN